MVLLDRVHEDEEFQMVFLQVSNLTKGEVSYNRHICNTKNVAMATTIINFNGA